MVCSPELDAVLKLPWQRHWPLLQDKANNDVELSQRLVVVEVVLLTQGTNQELRCQWNPIGKDRVFEHSNHPSIEDLERHMKEQVLPKVLVNPRDSFKTCARQGCD